MSAFRTPLFIALLLFEPRWFDGKQPPTIVSDGRHAFIEARVLETLGRGWFIETAAIDEQPLVRRLYCRFSDPVHPDLVNLVAGAQFLAWGRIAAPSAEALPGADGWNHYLQRLGASGSFNVDDARDLKIIRGARGAGSRLESLRLRLAVRLKEAFPDASVRGLIGGLVLGEKRLLEASLEKKFAAAGVMHLLVASGLHVALCSGFLFFLARKLWGLPRLVAAAMVVAGTWAFAFFLGASPPVLRAALMASFLWTGPFFKRETTPLARLFLAVFLLLAWDPGLFRDAGFLLSAFSTFGLIYGWQIWGRSLEQRFKNRWARPFVAAAAATLFAWYSILPLSAAFFHEISLIAPLSNAVLVPFSSLLLGLGAADLGLMEWSPFGREAARWATTFAAQRFIDLAHFFGSWPAASFAARSWGWTAMAAWSLVFFLRRNLRWNAAVVAAALALLGFDGLCRLWASPRLYLFSNGEGFAAAYLEKAYGGGFCLADSQISGDPALLSASWRAFLKSRGHSGSGDACLSGSTGGGNFVPSGAFSGVNRQMAISCGREFLAFPLSPYPIIPDDRPARLIECRGGRLVQKAI